MSLLVKIFLALALLTLAGAKGEQIHFRTGIVPILSKAGCNSGACHGAATGQGGFRLSLLGYDPEEDFWNITREFQGRRIELDNPGQSLFLLKPTHQVDHEGGRRIRRDSDNYKSLLRWIESGAPYGSRDLRVQQILVEPSEAVLTGTNETVQLKVKAILSDGNKQDVTSLALFSSNDDGIAEINADGLVTTRSRGQASLMIRYAGQVASARITVPFGDHTITNFPASNFIDEELLAELKRLGLPPSPLSSDAEFLRRASLDITGRLPDANVARAFLSQPQSSAARAQLVESLVQTDEFTDFWAMKLADLLLISGKQGSEIYYSWLRDQIARNESWDQIARALLTASGNITESGPPNFYLLANDPRDMAEQVGSIFLSAQIGCARCHAHPTDRWTQSDYYQFAAYFTRLSREDGKIALNSRTELFYPKTKIPARPRPLGSEDWAPLEEDPRTHLAQWMVHHDNPLFARAFVNRVWKQLLGRGLVEPVNDLRPTNPASLPGLLDKLTAEFVGHNYDIRWLVRTIATSRTYQLSSRSNEINKNDARFFSRAYLKPLPAQVLLDAISQVTEVPEVFAEQPPGTRAVQLAGTQTPSYALDVLGRCKRERPCEPSASGGGLAQALHLINGTTINSKLKQGVLDRLQREKHSLEGLIQELYLRALTRFPAPEEMAFWQQTISSSENTAEALEDFLWTLLNSREFAYNH